MYMQLCSVVCLDVNDLALHYWTCGVAFFQDQTNIETKIKNIRFIGELCKFRIAPAGLVFTCLKVCSASLYD